MPALVAAGHQVTATTRSPGKTASLSAAGATPVVVDGLDALAVGEAVAKAEPEVIIHEMTAIPPSFGLRHFDRTFAVTNELRSKGLDNLLTAAAAAGVSRVIAQSYAGWPNARTGGPVKTEEDPLDPDPPAEQRAAIDAIRYLEDTVTSPRGITGLALRYSSLYGPGTTDQVIAMIRKRRFLWSGTAAESGRRPLDVSACPCDYTDIRRRPLVSAAEHNHPVSPEGVAAARAGVLSAGDAGRLAGLLGMLADPVRSRILFALSAAAELCVGDLALALDVTEDQVSYALKMLRLAGMVSFRKDGRMVCYRLSDGFPHRLLEQCLRELLTIAAPDGDR